MKPPRPGFRLRAAWAAILSLIVPGLGHIYARAWRIGIILVVANAALSVTIRLLTSRTPPTIPNIGGVALAILLSLALMLAAAADAARRLVKAGDNAAPSGLRWFQSTWAAAILLIAFGFGTAAVIPFQWRTIIIPSASMVPALMVGDSVIADIRPGLRIQRGDVIVFTHAVPPVSPDPDNKPALDAVYVKRVIAIPGDRIAIRDGRVVLNGQPLPRRDDADFIIPQYMSFGIKAHRWTETLPSGISYQVVTTADASSPDASDATKAASRTMPEITIPPGQTFVLGDNRDNSLDSRSPGFGTIPIGRVFGQARTIYWSRDRTRVMTPVL